MTGRFIIDLASIKNTRLEGDELQPILIAHVLSDDVFRADRLPTVSFALKHLTPITGSHATASN